MARTITVKANQSNTNAVNNAKEIKMNALKMPVIQVKASSHSSNPFVTFKQVLEVEGCTYFVYYTKRNWSVYAIFQELNDGTGSMVPIYIK